MERRIYEPKLRSHSVYLPEDFWLRIRAVAKRRDRSVSYIIREAVKPLLEAADAAGG